MYLHALMRGILLQPLWLDLFGSTFHHILSQNFHFSISDTEQWGSITYPMSALRSPTGPTPRHLSPRYLPLIPSQVKRFYLLPPPPSQLKKIPMDRSSPPSPPLPLLLPSITSPLDSLPSLSSLSLYLSWASIAVIFLSSDPSIDNYSLICILPGRCNVKVTPSPSLSPTPKGRTGEETEFST